MKSKIRIEVMLLSVSLGIGLSLMSGCTLRHSTTQQNTTVGTPPANTVVEAQPEWFACQTHIDCKIELGVCSEPQAVNVSFLEIFQQYRNRMNQMVDCTSRSPVKVPKKAYCVAHRCSVEASDKTSNP